MTVTPSIPSGIKAGAVVSCRFPHQEAPAQPGPTARPCLVIRTMIDTPRDRWMAVVAYGTSKTGRANSGFEYTLTGAAATAAGLNRPTRFVLNRLRLLPVDEAFFVFSGKSDGAIGQIPEDERPELATAMSRMRDHIPRLAPILAAHTPAKTQNASAIDTMMREHARGRNPNGRNGKMIYVRSAG